MRRLLYAVALCSAAGWTSEVWAGRETPEQAVEELEMQLNSKFVDEVLGPVDYEFVYVKEGAHAYPLGAVLAYQAEARSAVPSDTLGWNLHVPVDSSKVKPIAERVVLSRKDSVLAGFFDLDKRSRIHMDKLRNPNVNTVYDAASRPFEPRDRAALSTHPPRRMHARDRKGDPASFDLSGMDLAALQGRPMPSSMQQIEGVQIGVRIAERKVVESPLVTRIDSEHDLRQRRVMRLDLSEFYARLPQDAYVDLEVEQVVAEGDRAVAQVTWRFTDSELSQSTPLRLQRQEDGWRIDQTWNFIQQLMAAR